nr:hypothetical protein pA2H2_p60 [Arthrobacter sp.]
MPCGPTGQTLRLVEQPAQGQEGGQFGSPRGSDHQPSQVPRKDGPQDGFLRHSASGITRHCPGDREPDLPRGIALHAVAEWAGGCRNHLRPPAFSCPGPLDLMLGGPPCQPTRLARFG